jgi:hypothetical protein
MQLVAVTSDCRRENLYWAGTGSGIGINLKRLRYLNNVNKQIEISEGGDILFYYVRLLSTAQ